MTAKYRHTQYGNLMFLVFVSSGIFIAAVAQKMLSEDRVLSTLLMTGMYVFGVLMFYSLTIEVAEKKLTFWFGIGILRKAIAVREIQSTKEVTNPWYYFWGVKSIPGGWLYAIASGSAVEIRLSNGSMMQIGTNQPKILIQAIESARQEIIEYPK